MGNFRLNRILMRQRLGPKSKAASMRDDMLEESFGLRLDMLTCLSIYQ